MIISRERDRQEKLDKIEWWFNRIFKSKKTKVVDWDTKKMTEKKRIDWEIINICISRLFYKILDYYNKSEILKKNKLKVYPIKRGGCIVAGMLKFFSEKLISMIILVNTPEECDIMVDDIYDSGNTAKRYEDLYHKPIFFLIDKRVEYQNVWAEFPWDEEEEKDIKDNALRLIQHFNNDKEKAKEYLEKL